jgi:hypothetical protein
VYIFYWWLYFLCNSVLLYSMFFAVLLAPVL